MLKNKVIIFVAAVMLFMTTVMNAKAAVPSNCPLCATDNIVTPLQVHGEQVGYYTEYHTMEYSENHNLHTITCTVNCSVANVYWYCNKEHGCILTKKEITKKHSYSGCQDVVYYP